MCRLGYPESEKFDALSNNGHLPLPSLHPTGMGVRNTVPLYARRKSLPLLLAQREMANDCRASRTELSLHSIVQPTASRVEIQKSIGWLSDYGATHRRVALVFL